MIVWVFLYAIGYVCLGILFDIMAFSNNEWERADIGVVLIWPLFFLKRLIKFPGFLGTSIAGGVRKLRQF